jgi:hypothetical protein
MYAHGSARDVLDEESGGGSSADGSRQEVVRGAAAKWKRDLADVSGRNALLFFKDVKAGTLDLAEAEGSALRRLLDGADVRLSDLFPTAGPAAAVDPGHAECHPDAQGPGGGGALLRGPPAGRVPCRVGPRPGRRLPRPRLVA